MGNSTFENFFFRNIKNGHFENLLSHVSRGIVNLNNFIICHCQGQMLDQSFLNRLRYQIYFKGDKNTFSGMLLPLQPQWSMWCLARGSQTTISKPHLKVLSPSRVNPQQFTLHFKNKKLSPKSYRDFNSVLDAINQY